MKIFRKRASVVVVHNGQILGFHGEDPTTKKMYFFLPGGAPESSESLAEAAKRETLEETGYEIKVLEETGFVNRYDFTWNGKIYDCETWFYRGVLKSSEALLVQDADYHRGVGWIALEDVDKTFSYSAEILESVRRLIQ